jgi:hypothetical protein
VSRLAGWLTEPVPRSRLAAFRTLVYLFVVADLVWFTPWVRAHGRVPGELYRPILAARLLHVPAPTVALVNTEYWLLLAAALAAATGRAPRLLGWPVLAMYAHWMIVAMSYGKVDHDRFALLIALATLPTAGPARHGDHTPSEAAGWALRVTQLAAVATYALSAWAKLRFGGPQWLTGATLARAMLRRGTPLGLALATLPGALVVAQCGLVAFELGSPLVFALRGRARYLAVAGFYGFHALVFATVTISFVPQQVALASFLPLEVATRRLARTRAGRTARVHAGRTARVHAGRTARMRPGGMARTRPGTDTAGREVAHGGNRPARPAVAPDVGTEPAAAPPQAATATWLRPWSRHRAAQSTGRAAAAGTTEIGDVTWRP